METKKKTSNRFSPEVRARAVRMVRPPESPSDVDALYGGVMGVGG